ncbi:response regulator transcription factor [Cyclobacterium marinum]|uniref:Two component transcriptional regulator, winged helix family n=1 Tax=Cyclobacterium marinum (strain ATCC 25205 / DSM 745 / LMG 13164 / NCIMB 1802) TaxID=880070 RepID=G0J3Q6_CYCMS|nr:response regulator transcription factor [Cyclobacterium marinum]AEL25262.1 two component transcriptional regulator, winged helix family [Cyclobacterium marinum DSM 745]MBI0400669.1 response regulator transcription factor [Cyclobacterium marinum]
MKVLIIEDDPTLNKNINEALKVENLNTEYVFDGLLADRMLRKNNYDCIIMDINLPGKNGFDLCKEFRLHNAITPVIMLTAFSELEDKIQGFDCGADDYLTKPFFMRELTLRVHSLIKRNKQIHSTNPSILVADDLTINDAQKKVHRQGKEISLTPREYQILMKLMEKKGEIVSKPDLIKEIWGSTFDANTNTIEVYVNFLRNKLDKPFGKNTIKTKVGFGYYLDLK